jgi:diguanylate cyclase (GGDEF)-like protein
LFNKPTRLPMRCEPSAALNSTGRRSYLQLERSRIWACAAAFICLHAACIVLLRSHADAVSSFFYIVTPGFASISCLHRANHSPARIRHLWFLASLALALWTVGAVLSAREEFFLHANADVGGNSQIVYFLYGIPLLVAIAAPTESQWSALFVTMDGLQVLIMGLATYALIFNVVPFTHQTIEPVSSQVVVLAFNIENIVLACASTLRFRASPAAEEDRHFFRSLAIFLWVYAAFAALYNHVTLTNPGPMGFYNLMQDLPFLSLAVLALLLSSQQRRPIRSTFGATLAVLLDNASPFFFPAAILALGIAIASHHFSSGVIAITASLGVYGIRSTLLQFRYHRSQMEAREARDAMEVVSLTDQLTGVSNRRHFDRVFDSEWNRRSRQSGPLSLILVDIDHFKVINDKFGHGEGDICLRQVAHALKASLQRESDSLARYGGEEFAALLPGTDPIGAEAVALRMQTIIRGLKLRTSTPAGNTVTISIGIATSGSTSAQTTQSLFEAADQALYRAKQNGRNRIEQEPWRMSQIDAAIEVHQGGPGVDALSGTQSETFS